MRANNEMLAEAQLFYERGVNAVFDKNYDGAEYFFLKSAEIDPSELNYGSLGWLYGTIFNDGKRALSFFRKAIFQNPKNGGLYNDYGALLLRMGELKASLKWFSRAIKLENSEKKHFALYNLALVYRRWERPRTSLRYLRLALKHKPLFFEAQQLYDIILNEKKQASLGNN